MKPRPIREDIGGRYLSDITQFSYSVGGAIKDHYPMNGVPPALVEKVARAHKMAEELEDFLAEIMIEAKTDEMERN